MTTVAAVEIAIPGGATVRGQRWGEGAAVALLLHAPGEDLDAWGVFPVELVAAGLGVVAVDLPGHGLSDGPWCPERLEETIAAVLDGVRPAAGGPLLVVAAGASGGASVRAGSGGRVAAVVVLHGDEGEGAARRVDRAPPALIVVGAGDEGALVRARAQFRSARGYAVLSAVPTSDVGIGLLFGGWGRQVREQIVAFLRDYGRVPGGGPARSAG